MANKRITVGPMTARELIRIIERYHAQYGNITISELIDKFKTDVLILN